MSTSEQASSANISEQVSSVMDMAPALKMYLDSIESWKENYKNLLETPGMSKGGNNPDFMTTTVNSAVESWQTASAELFKRFVEEQIELCHFFGHRWERYLDLPQQISRCHSANEMGQLQIDFMSRMMTEYAQESAKMMQPMSDFCSKLMSTGRLH